MVQQQMAHHKGAFKEKPCTRIASSREKKLTHVIKSFSHNLHSQFNGCACGKTHRTHGLPAAVTWVKQGLMGATINNMVVLSDKQVGDGVL
jgi:hypothetical protein